MTLWLEIDRVEHRNLVGHGSHRQAMYSITAELVQALPGLGFRVHLTPQTTLYLVAEFASPQKVYTFSFRVVHIESLKCIHSATKFGIPYPKGPKDPIIRYLGLG